MQEVRKARKLMIFAPKTPKTKKIDISLHDMEGGDFLVKGSVLSKHHRDDHSHSYGNLNHCNDGFERKSNKL